LLHLLHFFAVSFLFFLLKRFTPFQILSNLVKESKSQRVKESKSQRVKESKCSWFEPVEKTSFFFETLIFLRLWKVLKEKNVKPSLFVFKLFLQTFCFLPFFDQKLFSKKAKNALSCLQKLKKNQNRQNPLSKFWYTKVFSSKRCFTHSDFAFFDSAFFNLLFLKRKAKILKRKAKILKRKAKNEKKDFWLANNFFVHDFFERAKKNKKKFVKKNKKNKKKNKKNEQSLKNQKTNKKRKVIVLYKKK
jgi:hypothetical protein